MNDTAGKVISGKRRLLAVALLGLAVGFLWRGCLASPPPASETPAVTAAAAVDETWTCSMHPQIRLPKPGKCPICEMPLIVAAAAQTGSGGEPMLELSEHAMTMASVETTPVTRRELSRELRAVGKIQYNESSLATITARIDGYAERLFVDFTGVEIRAGDHLAEIYSPELLVAQQELLVALSSGPDGKADRLAEMAKVKLQRWGLTTNQIADLVGKNVVADRITLYSPIQGTVIEKSIVQNSSFKAGDALYRIANLDTVWVYLDIYEVDLPWVRYGQGVEIIAEALPGRVFDGRVTFVQPIVNEETRTVRVPVHVENADHALKPGMFVSAVIQSALAGDGRAAPTGVEGRYSCPMHPQVLAGQPGPCPFCEMPLERIPGLEPAAAGTGSPEVSPPPAPTFFCPMKCEGEKTYDQAGNCPVCNMKLVPVPSSPAAAGVGLLAVPASAVLDSGTRRIVYVEKSRGLFEPREIVTGPPAGEFVPVLSGIADGERVVTRGGFLIDSQFQISGQPSLFYPGGLMDSAAPHAH
ncbi:MAG: efflux RND transporter periplasmic adaptor subunit [Kiritimatiellia bacterium]